MGDDNMRLRLQQQGAVLSSQLKVNDDDKVTQNEKGKKDARPIMSRNSFLCFILTNFLLLAYVLFFRTSSSSLQQQSNSSSITGQKQKSIHKKIPWDEYENCTIKNRPSSSSSTRKPLWAPSYPNTLDDSILKNLISTITGLSTGVKSYYAQRKGLRKCQSSDVTVLCHVVHPIVTTNPLDLTSMFDSQVIYIIRNPTTVFPVHLNYKAIKYHHHPSKTQVAVDSWRKDRDLYFADGLQGWKDQIKEWKVSMKEVYNISMFIPFEHLVDATKGPELLKRLTKLLEDFGFPIVVADDDMPCVWYKALGKEILEQIDSHGYEYSDYMPGYTQEHKDLLMKELSSMVEEYKDDDKELLLILQEYMDQVQSDLSLDQPYKDV
mmetsp:Transcript_14430/g.21163  ORF Transcript_14430/g.21163 Transcript_14430/m.21163 type:complete len:378 (-) Transcript_14430:67-1200(-)